LARQLRILAPRSATDEELQLVHSKAQVAGLKRAQLAASGGLVWLPVKGCLETCHWLMSVDELGCDEPGSKIFPVGI